MKSHLAPQFPNRVSLTLDSISSCLAVRAVAFRASTVRWLTALCLSVFLIQEASAKFPIEILYKPEYASSFYAQGGLTRGPDGTLYGTSSVGTGVVFALRPNTSGGYTYAILHAFNGSDGAQPESGVILGPDGTLYGVTPLRVISVIYDGITATATYDWGTVFALKPDGSGGYVYSLILTFNRQNGADPNGRLLLASDGTLYGTTAEGGFVSDETSARGTVYSLKPNGSSGFDHSI